MWEHRIKCDAEVFNEMVAGRKRFEFRKNDRDYAVGDSLTVVCNSTGKVLRLGVSFILYSPLYGVPDGYCVMSVYPLDTCAPPPDADSLRAQLAAAVSRAEAAEAQRDALAREVEVLGRYLNTRFHSSLIIARQWGKEQAERDRKAALEAK